MHVYKGMAKDLVKREKWEGRLDETSALIYISLHYLQKNLFRYFSKSANEFFKNLH